MEHMAQCEKHRQRVRDFCFKRGYKLDSADWGLIHSFDKFSLKSMDGKRCSVQVTFERIRFEDNSEYIRCPALGIELSLPDGEKDNWPLMVFHRAATPLIIEASNGDWWRGKDPISSGYPAIYPFSPFKEKALEEYGFYEPKPGKEYRHV